MTIKSIKYQFEFVAHDKQTAIRIALANSQLFRHNTHAHNIFKCMLLPRNRVCVRLYCIAHIGCLEYKMIKGYQHRRVNRLVLFKKNSKQETA